MWASKTGKADDTPGMIVDEVRCPEGIGCSVDYSVAFGCLTEGKIFEGASHDRDR
jgi:hypothetical protein